MDIATGTPEDHPTPLPLDPSASPAVVAPTAIASSGMVQGGVAANTFASQAAAGEAQAAAAMHSGMSADADRRAHYQADIQPQGADYGDALLLPPVPANALPPASEPGLFPYQGDEPVSVA